MADKIYCGSGKEITFNDGGSLLKIKLGPNDLNAINDWANNNGGWCNIKVAKRREVSDKGYTHYLEIDQWRPDSQQSGGYQQSQPTQQVQAVQNVFGGGSEFIDDVPF